MENADQRHRAVNTCNKLLIDLQLYSLTANRSRTEATSDLEDFVLQIGIGVGLGMDQPRCLGGTIPHMESTKPLPRGITWFAPWTWKRRQLWVALVVMLLVGYPHSIGPAYYLVGEMWLPEWFFYLAYLPVFQMAMVSDATRDALIAYLKWFYPYVPFD